VKIDIYFLILHIFKQQRQFSDWGAIADRNFSTSHNFNVLLYDIDQPGRILCRVDTQDRKLVEISSNLAIPRDEFSCLDLNGDIVSGLSESLDTINQYDVRQMKKLDKINVFGLPSSLQFDWESPFRLQVSQFCTVS
jgi:hypothetical protein